MSDRIAVVNKGRIEQLGDSADIYHAPRTSFVANFIGQANILEAKVVGTEGRFTRLRLSSDVEVRILTDSRTRGRWRTPRLDSPGENSSAKNETHG